MDRMDNSIPTKLCPKCKQIKLRIDFYSRGKSRPNSVSSWCKTCLNQKTIDRSIENKHKAVEYLGGKCQRCGYNKCDAALEFHHRDPDSKDIGIKEGRSRNWISLKEELDKCDLLCANCHREIHWHI